MGSFREILTEKWWNDLENFSLKKLCKCDFYHETKILREKFFVKTLVNIVNRC